MPIDGLERVLSCRECHVTDGTQHDNAEKHRQRLEPEESETGENPQVEAAGEGSAPERQCALQPAGPGELDVGLQSSGSPLGPGLL